MVVGMVFPGSTHLKKPGAPCLMGLRCLVGPGGQEKGPLGGGRIGISLGAGTRQPDTPCFMGLRCLVGL